MGCPIFTYNDILQEAGMILKDEYLNKTKSSDEEVSKKDEISTLSIGELKKRMSQAIIDEDYELASKLRDEINKRKEK